MYMNFCNNWSCTRQETGEIVPVTLPHDAILSEKMLSNSKGHITLAGTEEVTIYMKKIYGS